MWTAQCLVPKADLNADVCEECFEADKQGGAGRKHRWPHITLNPEPVVAYQITYRTCSHSEASHSLHACGRGPTVTGVRAGEERGLCVRIVMVIVLLSALVRSHQF